MLRERPTGPYGEDPPMERLTFIGFLTRLAGALVLVALTYNPTGHSYIHWLSSTFPHPGPLPVIAGLLLIGGWAFAAHATWRSLGTFGLLLASGLFAAIVWLLVSWGWIKLGDQSVIGWLAVTLVSVRAKRSVAMTLMPFFSASAVKSLSQPSP